MAIHGKMWTVGHLTAAGDYNDAVDQYSVVRSTGTNFTIQTSAGGVAVGILQDRPSSGVAGTIAYLGHSKARVVSTAHTGIAVWDKLEATTGGGVGPSSGGVGRYVLGRALDTLSSATTGIINMIINHQGGGSSGAEGAV